METIRRNKKFIIYAAGVVVVSLLVYIVFFMPGIQQLTTKPPVVSVNSITVVGSRPAGNIKTLNRLFSASVKFSESIGTDLSGINVFVSPSIGVKKYSVSAEPETLWIEPVNTGVDPGWKDDVSYTITIKKGSTISSGAVLKEDFSFSFSNSTAGITMYAN